MELSVLTIFSRLEHKERNMNKRVKFLAVMAAAFVIGMSVNNYAMSSVPSNFKVGIIDIQKVVGSSNQVKALKKEQQAKTQEIVKFVETARKDVASITDEKKKKTVEDKYNKELVAKKDKMEKEYASKLSAIDASISKTVQDQAKAGNYDVVLAKGVVLYGGDDLTEAVVKALK